MDLRKLRDRPDSEVAQFKKWSKKLNDRINIRSILIFCICSIFCAFAFYFLWIYTHQKPKEPIKIYRAVEPSIPLGNAHEKMPANGSTQGKTDTVSSSEAPTTSPETEGIVIEKNPRTEPENETSASTTQNVSEAPVSSEQGAKGAADEEARKVAERLKAKKAEVDQMLADGDALLDQARNTVNRAVPILVNHLNSLSSEAQIKFLNQVRSQMYSASSPELQELMDNDPELEEKTWQTFLGRLRDNGFDPPN